MSETAELISAALFGAKPGEDLRGKYATEVEWAWAIAEKMQQDFDALGLQINVKFWTAWVVKRGLPSLTYQVNMPGTAMEAIYELAIVAYQLKKPPTPTPTP